MTGRPSAEELRRTAPPDVLLGSVSLWIGGVSGNDGWLDVAVRVGNDYRTIAEAHGPLLQKKDLAAFEPALRDLSEAEEGEILLWSEGGSLTIRVKRYGREHGNHVEVGLRESIFDQKISFSMARTAYAGALIGIRAVLTRLDEELERSRRPLPLLDPAPAWQRPARQTVGAIGPGDYPPDSLERSETGVAEIDFLVSAGGMPEDIRLVASSGFETLDSATLGLIASRFRYDPALDANGAPVPQRLRRKLAWLIWGIGPVVWDASELELQYIVDGVGWFTVEAFAGAWRGGSGGSSWMTEPVADLLRAGTALAGGVRRAEILFDSEPFLSRMEFEVETLNSSVPARGNQWTATDGCWIRIRDIDHRTMEAGELSFEALCFSPLAVAEAIYRMALPLFEQNDRTDLPHFAALAAAIRAARAGEATSEERPGDA